MGKCSFCSVLSLACRIFVRLVNRSGICWLLIMVQVVSKKPSDTTNQKINATVLCEILIIHSCSSCIGCLHKWKYFTLTLVSWFHDGSSTFSGIKLKRDLITLNHQNVKMKFTASRIINTILFQFGSTCDCFKSLCLKSWNYKEVRCTMTEYFHSRFEIIFLFHF